MIRVTVELLKGGRNGPVEVLGTATIVNDATGTAASGNYVVQFFDRAGRPWRNGFVKDFPREKLLWWDLLFRALCGAGVARRNPTRHKSLDALAEVLLREGGECKEGKIEWAERGALAFVWSSGPEPATRAWYRKLAKVATYWLAER